MSRTMAMKGRLIRRVPLFSTECLEMLREALEVAQSQDDLEASVDSAQTRTSTGKSRYDDDSSSDEDEHVREEEKTGSSSDSSHSSKSDGSDTEDAGGESPDRPAASLAADRADAPTPSSSSQRPTSTRRSKRCVEKKQLQATIYKHVESLTCLPFELNDASTINVPTSLLPKEERRSIRRAPACESYLNLTTSIGPNQKPVVVLFVRSGRFAGGVFRGQECLRHRTSQRYTVRKGQGKAQSAQDSSRRPKSMGAQLRREGERALNEDIANTIREWSTYLRSSALILISCPKTMRKALFDSAGEFLSKDDDRIRRVPLDLGRPTFENVCTIHSALLTATVREHVDWSAEEPPPGQRLTEIAAAPALDNDKSFERKEKRADLSIPMSSLHLAAAEGDHESLCSLLESVDSLQEVNNVAGELLMTPLHFAAESEGPDDASKKADCVDSLLTIGRADPCVVDARNRPPYFLASSDKVREAFRRARAALGEDFCDWDAAKVGPPLTEEDMRLRREKEAEKKRKKRARQKKKKAEEKLKAEAQEKQRLEEEQKKARETEAKRIRDGLQPRLDPKATNACDYCQKVVRGKSRRQMFQRLDYVYCSTDCVQKHKRELMASAALSRLEVE